MILLLVAIYCYQEWIRQKVTSDSKQSHIL